MFNEILTPTAFIVIAAIIIVMLCITMVLCVRLSNIMYMLKSMVTREDDMKDLLTNMVQGSKRIERNVDAINQRTRAATAKKSNKPKIDKRGAGSYDGKSSKSTHSKNNSSKRNSSIRK